MKSGTSRETGKLITGVPYLMQRLSDALNTPTGSLVVDRDYGSRMHELTDMNIDRSFRMAAYIRVAECIDNPKNGLDDLTLTELTVTPQGDGANLVNLYGEVDGEDVELAGIKVNG